MNQVIIINGPSCAGKTTIAKEICKQSNNKFVHLQVDESKKYLFTILDVKATPRNIGRPICDNILIQTALIFLHRGYGVVIDTIFDGDDATQIAQCISSNRSDTQEILGFIICKLMLAPEVYNPGGLTLMVDDFCVQSENLWQSVGASLIEETKAAANARGATQIVVVCGAHDHPKRKFLSEQNLQVASEWFVGGIV